MAVKTAGSATAATDAQERYTTGSVISKDGTTISYRQLGHGPGVLLVHGSMSSAQHYMQLAEMLANEFTVYVIDRRGFGLSGPFSPDDGIQQDVEDVDALLTKADTHNVFGVSAGAIIGLKAALSLPAIHKLAIYEPPLFMNSAVPTAMMKRFDAEMAQGKVAAALTTAMKGAPLISDMFSAMPRFLIEFMTKRMLSFEAKKSADDYGSFTLLAPTLHHDGRVISQMSGQQERLRAIRAKVLLLGGSKSTAFLKAGLDSVAKVLPQARRIEFPGLNHSSTWNRDVRGKPEAVAQELRQFFRD
jgi:pimeloyl-ACP methyl ester carboxylesterase